MLKHIVYHVVYQCLNQLDAIKPWLPTPDVGTLSLNHSCSWRLNFWLKLKCGKITELKPNCTNIMQKPTNIHRQAMDKFVWIGFKVLLTLVNSLSVPDMSKHQGRHDHTVMHGINLDLYFFSMSILIYFFANLLIHTF